MDPHDRTIAMIKEFLALFGVLTFVGALVNGRYLSALVILAVVLYLVYERPIRRWIAKQFGSW